MSGKYKVKKPKVIILDIEGTITPIDFVHKTLFGYIRKQISEGWTKRNESSLVALGPNLIDEYKKDFKNNDATLQDLDRCITELMDKDSKTTTLKQIQALIMKEGYEQGSLKSELFDDVKDCVTSWKSAKVKIYIYSSGNVDAQRMLLSNTRFGDISNEIDGFFDTRVGAKFEPNSYLEILKQVEVNIENPKDDVIFVTDNLKEVDAATIAGLRSIHIMRPGNPSNQSSAFETICSFNDIKFFETDSPSE